jgi:hypothetical protein
MAGDYGLPAGLPVGRARSAPIPDRDTPKSGRIGLGPNGWQIKFKKFDDADEPPRIGFGRSFDRAPQA